MSEFDLDKLFDLYGAFRVAWRIKRREGMTREEFDKWRNIANSKVNAIENEVAPEREPNIHTNMKRGLPGIETLYNKRNKGTALLIAAGKSGRDFVKSNAITTLPKSIFTLCVDRIYPLLSTRITPDLVITGDPSTRCVEWLKDCKSNVAMSVVSSPKLPDVVDPCSIVYRFAPCRPRIDFWERMYNQYGKEMANTLGAHTVTHAAVSVLVFIGFNRIITIGNELCFWSFDEYATDYNRVHVPTRREGLLTISAFAKNAVGLRFYPMMFKDVQFIDVSGGLTKPEWKKMKLEDALGKPNS